MYVTILEHTHTHIYIYIYIYIGEAPPQSLAQHDCEQAHRPSTTPNSYEGGTGACRFCYKNSKRFAKINSHIAQIPVQRDCINCTPHLYNNQGPFALIYGLDCFAIPFPIETTCYLQLYSFVMPRSGRSRSIIISRCSLHKSRN